MPQNRPRVAELFAGIGGFRVGMEPLLFDFVYANQWEPAFKNQFAAKCYERHFGVGSCDNRPLQEAVKDPGSIPSVDMVVAGLCCEDYSIAARKDKSQGIEGKKGSLWWSLLEFIKIQLEKDDHNARFVLIENVDRLLRSPAKQRGRDFAIMLSCLMSLGYTVEWEIIDSADFGFPTRRKRVYILATRNQTMLGEIQTAFPYELSEGTTFAIPEDLTEIMESFGGKRSPFKTYGTAADFEAITYDGIRPLATYDGPHTLGDCLEPESNVPPEYYLTDEQLKRFQYLKGAKSIPRVNKNGRAWHYSEGAMVFPDKLDAPSRTITTMELRENGVRMSHVIYVDGRYRRLLPVELERLHGFPDNWTDDMTRSQRAFCIGNSLVIGIPREIGRQVIYNI